MVWLFKGKQEWLLIVLAIVTPICNLNLLQTNHTIEVDYLSILMQQFSSTGSIELQGWIVWLFMSFIIFVLSFYINWQYQKAVFIELRPHIIAFFSILILSIFNTKLLAFPVLIWVVVMYYIFGRLIAAFDAKEKIKAFNLSFLSSIVSLVYLPATIMVILFPVLYHFVRGFSIRIGVQHFLGWVIPFYFFVSIVYLTDQLLATRDILSQIQVYKFSFFTDFAMHEKGLVAMGLLLCIIVVSLIIIFRSFNQSPIRFRQATIFSSTLLIFSIIHALFWSTNEIYMVLLLIISSLFLISYAVLKIQNKFAREVLPLFLIAILVYMQYL